MVHHVCMCGKELSCVQLFYNSKDYSPPASSIHGIFQTSILEWVAMPYSRGSSQPRDQTHVSHVSYFAGRFLTAEPPGKPLYGWFEALKRDTEILFWIYCLQCTRNFKFYHHLNFQVSVLRYHKNTWSSKLLEGTPVNGFVRTKKLGLVR